MNFGLDYDLLGIINLVETMFPARCGMIFLRLEIRKGW